MGNVLFGDWEKAFRRLNGMGALGDRNMEMAMRKNSVDLRDFMVATIDLSGPGWTPLKPATIKRKKSSKPLIQYGDLRQSINVKPIVRGSVFVGVPRAAIRKRGQKGKSLMNIAAVHEYGAPKAGIPARPFIFSTLNERRDALHARYRDAAKCTVLGQVYHG